MTQPGQRLGHCHQEAGTAQDTASFARLSYLGPFGKPLRISDPLAMLDLQGFLSPFARVRLSFPGWEFGFLLPPCAPPPHCRKEGVQLGESGGRLQG